MRRRVAQVGRSAAVAGGLALLLLAGALLPALPAIAQEAQEAQDAPAAGEGAGQTAVYLPLVGAAQPGGPGGGPATEVIEDHKIVLGEEPAQSAAAKPDVAPPDYAPPPPPGEAGAAGEVSPASPAEADAWHWLASEFFESGWPKPNWRIFDANAATSGEVYWNDTSYTAYAGGRSLWAAGGGANGRNPTNANYAPNMRSWAIYGPVSLAEATSAYLRFAYWNNSEPGFDYFGWYASVDGVNFYGQRSSGFTGGWQYRSFYLGNVPGYGSMLDNGSVWIAFVFTSDGSTELKGAFVDNVVLEKYTPEFTAYYYNGTAFNDYKYYAYEPWPIQKNWGTGSPAPGVINNDNFSVKWVGAAAFQAGTYTFYAKSDDGVRIYVDDALVVNGWSDHGYLPFSGDRTLTAGAHKVEVQYYEKVGGAAIEAWWVKKAP